MKKLLFILSLFSLSAHASLNYGPSLEQSEKNAEEKVIKDEKTLPEKKQPSTIQGEIQREEQDTGETRYYGDRRRKAGQLVPYGIK